MFKGAPEIALPRFPIFSRLAIKVVLGVFFLSFLLDYQPTLSFPPIRQSTVRAVVEQSQTIEAKSLPFVASLPHPGYLSTHFSSFHPGIDIAAGLGMPIHPIAAGVVISTGYNFWGLGLTATLDHGEGYHSLYAHLGKIYVKPGQNLTINDTLGEVGLTGHTSGPHTHLEISKDGQNFDPLTILPEIRQLPKQEDFIFYASGSAILQAPLPQ